MNRMIIPLPPSIEEDKKPLFHPNWYDEPEVRVITLKQAFVTFNGIIMNKGIFPVKDSFYQYTERKNEFIKKGKEQALHSLLLKKVPYTAIRQSAFVIHQPWMNFYHWMLESLPRLIQVKKHWNDRVLVIPERTLGLSYVRETMTLFPEVRILATTNDNLWVKDLLLPSLRPECHLYNRSLLRITREEVLNRITQLPDSQHRKLFIIRKKAAFRTIVNMEESIHLMEELGYETVDLEDYTLTDQIRIIHSASHIVTQHGAALSHLLFAAPGTKVLELHKALTNPSDHLSRVYWHLATIMDLRYDLLFCEPEDKNEDFFKASVYLDLEKTKRILNSW